MMAGADLILKKILDDARADAAATLEEASERTRVLEARSRRAMEETREKTLSGAKAAAAQKRERQMRMAQLDARKEELTVKREIIDQAFVLAEEKLLKLDAAQKETLYTRMLLEAAAGGEELIPAESEGGFFTPAIMKKMNEALKAAGRDGVTLSSGRRPIRAGFVLRNGGMECNCSLEALLRQSREMLEPLVARELFPGQEG